ncbi:hypothetical protein BD410DRAFT_789087 [Rickenella mellea]|uniref:F-box domain-containing protein n=1 Tax=Rickenella mellea TaxID=50990 RepID=A0A4Y7Q2X7_9AGAM|nr:hypothetical protein BD410DRAFT_789087 [Rickenella mellea]
MSTLVHPVHVPPGSLRGRVTAASSPKTRQRKPLQPVDTNVSSYDRKDPFAAFNTLRKLLGSLTSRIGGCQFKLTPEEHKLSMHLLTIVEPFVGLSPSRRTITRQPTEILDAISFHIDAKRDLLSLGLSCKRMYDVVFPRHFEYRVVRCKISSISVWNHMTVHRSLAQNVRRLEIMDERASHPIVAPSSILATDTDLESSDDELGMHDKQERFLLAALAKMTALESFVWSCNHSLISIDDIWPTLLKCQTIKSVEINDNLIFGPILADERAASSTRPTILPDLRSVAFRSTKHSYGQSKFPDLKRVTNMLHHCPNLEVLNIGYETRRPAAIPRVDDFILYGRWPSLRVLTLVNLSCSIDLFSATASSFLLAHLNLEVLHLDIGRTGPLASLTLPPNALPRLRELKSSKEVANTIMSCPCIDVPPRPLDTIKGVHLGGQAWDAGFFENVKRYAVKRLELSGFNEFDDIRRLVECVPKLMWLDVGKRGGNVTQNRAPVTISNVVEWAELLSQLPDLTTFHGIRFFYEASSADASHSGHRDGTVNITLSDRSRIKKNDEVASVISWKCPKLRRLDHWDDPTKVIVLLKNADKDGEGEKVRWEIRRVKAG